MDLRRGDMVEFSRLVKLISKVLRTTEISENKQYEVLLVEGNEVTIQLSGKPMALNYMLLKKVESGDKNVYSDKQVR